MISPARPDSEGRKDAPGWDAIDTELSRVYGSAQPEHYAPDVPSRLGGEEPLDGISAYRGSHPVPHWHLVSYGMSELYEKESDDPTTSGWGFEFTLRLARTADQATPPAWSLRLLRRLAGYVFDNARPFAPGHTMNPGGPLTGDESTRLAALAFTTDTELQPIDTPHGRLMFLQVVGVTLEEYEAAREWHTESFLDMLARTHTRADHRSRSGLNTERSRTSPRGGRGNPPRWLLHQDGRYGWRGLACQRRHRETAIRVMCLASRS